MKKIGRNDPCLCGSGKKFKKCHGSSQYDIPFLIQQYRIEKVILEKGKRLLEEHQAREIQRKKQQGLGRPIISDEVNGTRLVAVGKHLHYGKWKTFHDFLGDYIRQSLSADWGNAELKKPLADRHTVFKWYHHLCELQHKYATTLGSIFSAPMTGAASAYYRLAYNLYLIAHNGNDIQTRLLSRLRNIDNFPGAFFETQVAAWLIRAGFELEFENESDTSTTHCEFTATYPPTGVKFSVEAKSRYPGKDNTGPKRINVGHQLRLALEKQAIYARVVFLDLNRPIQSAEQLERPINRAHRILKNMEHLNIAGQPAPAAYVCLTNISDHYFLEGLETPTLVEFYSFKIPDFVGTIFPSIRCALRARERHAEMFALMRSIEMHSQIPVTFDGELPSIAFSNGEITQMKIGQTYLTPGLDGKEVSAQLTSATVDTTNSEMILAFHDPQTNNVWICKAPMAQSQLDDYKRFPDTYFGVYRKQGVKADTPLELFDFFYESWKNTPKDKLLELLASAPDATELRNLSQKDLSEIYCERMVCGAMEQTKVTAPWAKL